MAKQFYENNVTVFLDSGIDSAATTITVNDASRIPNVTGGDAVPLTLIDKVGDVETAWEIVHVTGKSGNILTVVRGQDGTSARAWTVSTPAQIRVTNGLLSKLRDDPLRIENNLSDIVNDATARANIDVYSTIEVDQAVDQIRIDLNSSDPSKGAALVNGAVKYVDVITAVNATGLTDGIVIVAKGHSVSGDGGGGVFRYSASSIQSTDGGLVFSPSTGSGRIFRDGWTVFGFNGAIKASWFGARFDGTTDDTVAIQAAWDSGQKEIEHPSGVALCGNLTLPSTLRVRLVGAGKEQTVIKAKSGISNTTYLAAQAAYINNATSGSNPLIIDGMQFDGNGLVNNTVVFYSFFSEFLNSQAKGALVAPLIFTSEGISGSNCTTTLVENKVINSTIDGTGATYSLLVDDSGGKCSDMIVIGNIIKGAARLDTMAGSNFSSNHFYSGTSAFNRLSTGSSINNNYFENAITLDDFKDEVVHLAGNTFLGRVTVSFGSDGKTAVFDGNVWQGAADVFHNFFASDKRIVVNGGGFETGTPAVFHNGTSTGWVSFNHVWNHSTATFWTGSRQATVSSIRQELPFSPAVSANFGDASATLTWTSSATTNRWTSTLTTDKTVTLSTTNAINGAKFKVVRTGGGAFNLNVGTGPLKSLATNQWCDVEYDGSAWVLTAFGSL